MSEAIEAAENWWNSDPVRHIFPTLESVRLGFHWMRQYDLGRKRVLDTQLAATFYMHGITRILTSNFMDYRVFGCFELVKGRNGGLGVGYLSRIETRDWGAMIT